MSPTTHSPRQIAWSTQPDRDDHSKAHSSGPGSAHTWPTLASSVPATASKLKLYQQEAQKYQKLVHILLERAVVAPQADVCRHH